MTGRHLVPGRGDQVASATIATPACPLGTRGSRMSPTGIDQADLVSKPPPELGDYLELQDAPPLAGQATG